MVMERPHVFLGTLAASHLNTYIHTPHKMERERAGLSYLFISSLFTLLCVSFFWAGVDGPPAVGKLERRDKNGFSARSGITIYTILLMDLGERQGKEMHQTA